jgi:hypothetical protein
MEGPMRTDSLFGSTQTPEARSMDCSSFGSGVLSFMGKLLGA